MKYKLTLNGIPFDPNNYLNINKHDQECDILDKIPTKTVEEVKALHLDFTKLHTGDSDVTAVKPNLCKHNDCGWCYYKGDLESNDDNGQCNKHNECEAKV